MNEPKAYSSELRLTLFSNDKGGNDKRPDMRGTLQIDGKEYKCSLWRKVTRDGKNREYWTGPIELATENAPRAADTPKQYLAEPRKPSLYAEASAVPGMRSEAENEVPF